MIDPPRQLAIRLRRIWSGSIGNRLVIGIGALLVAVMSVFIVDMVRRQDDFLHRQNENRATALAQTLAANSVSWVLASDLAGLQEVTHVVRRYPDLRYAMILARDGRVLAHSDPQLQGRYARDEVSASLLHASPVTQVLVGTSSLIDIAAPIEEDGKHLGWARVSLSQDSVSANLRRIARNGFIYGMVAVALGTLLALLLTRGLTRDLARLVEATRKVGAGERGVQSGLRREDELGELSSAFDGMASELEHASRGLRESEEKFRQVSAGAQDAIIVLDQDGVITDWNAAADKIFGYTAAEAIGRDLHMLLAPAAQRGAALQGLHRFRDSGAGPVIGRTLDLTALRRDGSEFPIELSISAIQLRGQWHAIGIVRDSSERKRAEEALRRSEAGLKEAQRLAHIGNWELNLDKNVLKWSDEVYRIFEIDPRRFGASYEAFVNAIHPDDRERVSKAYADSVTNKLPYVIEHRLLMSDGRVKYIVEAGETIYDKSGQPLRSIGTVQDVTVRRRAEDALREREEYIRRLIDRSPLAMLVSSGMEQRVELVNAKFTELFGYTIDDIPDVAHWWPLAYPSEQYRDEVKAKWSERVLGAIGCQGEIEPMEATVHCKDGALRYIEFRLSSIGARNLVTFVDLTQRKRAEEEQRAAALYTRSLIEASPDPLVTISAQGKITDLNKSTEDATGVARDVLIGTDFADYFTEPDKARAGYQEVLARGYVRDYPLTILHRAGHTMDVLYNATVYRNEAGELQGVFAAARDITERKQVEQKLLESEQRLRLHVEQTPLAVIEWDTDFRVVHWNPAAERIFGYTAAEATGRHASFIVAGAAKAAVDEVWTQLLSGRGGERSTNENVTKDGRAILCEWYNTPLIMSGGKAIGVASLVEDVTVRKQAEAVRTQLAAIVQSSHDAIVGKDLDGIITSWNPGAEKVYGYRAEEVVGKPVSILAPEGRKDEVTGLLERVRRGDAVMNFETERFRKDGRRIDISLDISPIGDASGCITGASTIARDITEKKQAERALKKLNRALKALSSCNEALIHASDEKQLLDRICRLIIDIEGYRMAWVGYVEHDENRTVRPVAQGGYEAGYLEHADMSWADDERGRGPLGLAIRSGQIQVVQDVTTDPRFEPWRANAARLGYGSVLVAPLLSDSKVLGALSIYAESINAFDAAEIALLGELAADMAFGIVTLRARGAQEQSAARLQHSMEATIQAIAGTVEMRDPYTAGHQRRVAELATAIAQAMGLTQDQVRGVHLAGVVHDLGKIHVPAEILSKPGKLTRIEFELIKAHPEAGYEILKGVDFPWPIAQIVLQHHERLDGSGYPRGLKADEILPAARIIAVADVVEAMSSHRPYRPSLGLEPALREISANAGKYYDADAARVCVALFREHRFAFKG